jgi:hypothetical protein
MVRRILTAVVLFVSTTTVSRAAAQRPHFGLHGGYNTDFNQGLVGAQIHMPLTPRSSCILRSTIISSTPGR